jgi:hypothetical protein
MEEPPMPGWRTRTVSFVVAAALLLTPAPGPRRVVAASGCSLGLSGTPRVGQGITISGSGYPPDGAVDVTFQLSGQETDAFSLTSDQDGRFRIDLSLETADIGATTIRATATGNACSAQLDYTVVGAGGGGSPATPTPRATPRPTATARPTASPAATPGHRATPKPRATPTPGARATTRPRATPGPTPKAGTSGATRTPRPAKTSRPKPTPKAAAAAVAASGADGPPPTDSSGPDATILLPALVWLAVALLALGMIGWALGRQARDPTQGR